VEGYKLYIPLYYSNFTSKWEVSGLLFLSTETKEKVEAGIRFFRDTLPYRIEGGGRFIFFTDKDFDYLSVLEDIFEGSLVLLCNVHTARYFREKVFTGKSYWGQVEDHNYLCGADKDDLMKQLMLVRDSPSEALYRERETTLLDMGKNLFVRPGQATKPVNFVEYYQKNWLNCAFRWVFAFRKNLPTNGANDTQAIEATFSAIKRFSKLEFPGRTPSLKELIQVLPRAAFQKHEVVFQTIEVVFQFVPYYTHVPAGTELGKNAVLGPIFMRSCVVYNTTPLAKDRSFRVWQKNLPLPTFIITNGAWT
jgi:hypothetical protein